MSSIINSLFGKSCPFQLVMALALVLPQDFEAYCMLELILKDGFPDAKLHKEKLEFDNIELKERSYK